MLKGEKKKAASGGMGGMGGMMALGGISDLYESAERSFTYKIKAE